MNYEYIKNSIFFLISIYIQQKNNIKKNEIYLMIKHFLPCSDLSKLYIKNIITNYLDNDTNRIYKHKSVDNLSELNNVSDTDSDDDLIDDDLIDDDFLIDYNDDDNTNQMINIQKNIDDLMNKIKNDIW
jgi:hypothetical protein